MSNQSDRPQTFDATFRIQGKAPDTWNPVTGEKRQLPQFQQQDGQTIVPMHLEPYQSLFVVFDSPASECPVSQELNYPKPTVLAQIDTPWTVNFQSEMRGPAEPQTFSTLTDWSQNQNDAIKYYAGKATYTNTFNLDKVPQEDIYLDLGRVMVMARVFVNDLYAGGVWTYPYRVPVSQFLKQGKNQIRIEVVNNWRNRLIGDARLPESERKTYATVNPYDANSSLQESGLLGPVCLMKY